MSALSPRDAAFEAARFLTLDPGSFLDQAALAGMVMFTDGRMIHFGVIDDAHNDWDRVAFLWALMKASKIGHAVRELLLKRGLVGNLVPA